MIFSLIAPYLSEYLKINYFAAIFAGFLAAAFFWKKSGFHLSFSSRQALMWIVFLGLILRLGWLGFSSHRPQTEWGPANGETDLINIHAIDMTRGVWFLDAQGNPTGRRPVGYPLFVGLVYKIFGVHTNAIWAAQLMLYALTQVILYKLLRLAFGDVPAMLGAFFFSIYPVSVYSIKLISDEHLFLPVWYGGLFLLLREVHGKKIPVPFLVYGLLFGYAAMIRTHPIFMPLVIAAAYLLMKIPWRKAFTVAVLTGVMMVMIDVPWIVRNVKAWGIPVMYTATSCFIYAQVNSAALERDGAGHIPNKGEEGFSEELAQASLTNNEGLKHQLCGKLMRQWIVAHPQDFAALAARNLIVFLSWNRRGGVWPIFYQFLEGQYDPARPLAPRTKKILEEMAFAAYYVLFHLAISGVFLILLQWKKLGAEQRNSVMLLGTCFLFWFFEQMIIYPDRKYRYPLEPLMMGLAAYCLTRISEIKWKQKPIVQNQP